MKMGIYILAKPPMLLDRLGHLIYNEDPLAHRQASKEAGVTQAPHTWDSGTKEGLNGETLLLLNVSDSIPATAN